MTACFRRWVKLQTFFCLVAFLPFISPAQSLRIKRYTGNDGLAQNYVYDIVQDKRGFLWLATGDGLSRFDGYRFRTFNIADGLSENFSTRVFCSSKNTIWVGHHQGGITQIDSTGKLSRIPNGENTSTINGIAEDKSGNIWMATQREGIAMIDPAGKIRYFKDVTEGKLLYALGITPEGMLLAGSNEGLLLLEFKGGKLEYKGKIDVIPDTRITCITAAEGGKVFWIGTEDAGLFEYRPGKNDVRNTTTADGMPSDNIQAVMQDELGNVWIAFFGKGYSKFVRSGSSKLKSVPVQNPNPIMDGEFFRTIYQDREGQIWMGTYGHGLIYLRDEIFILHSFNAPHQEATVFSVLQDKSGSFWIGTDQGLAHISPGKILNESIFYSTGAALPVEPDEFFTEKTGMSGFPVTCLYEDKQGVIWAGTEKEGVFLIRPGAHKAEKLSMGDGAGNFNVNHIAEDSRHNLWIATKNGVFRLGPGGEQSYYTTMEGLPHNNIVYVSEAPSGEVWLAAQSQSVTTWDGKKFGKIQLNDTSGYITEITAFVQDNQGNMWVGTKGEGIYRIGKDKKMQNFTVKKSGLMSDFVYFVQKDKAGNIWAGHRNGVSKYVAATGKFVIFDNQHGFPNGENMQNATTRDKEGNLWFGSTSGFIKYNPIKDKVVLREPNTFISSVTVGDVVMEPGKLIRLPYRSNRIKFEFLGLTFKDQDKVRYQYKLEGNDLDWSELGPENAAVYQGLTDGNYTFLVKACSAEGLCNQEPVRLSFVVLAPFWKRWYFIASLVLAIVLGTYSFIQYRTAKLAREKAELEQAVAERTVELHQEKEKVEALNRNLEKLVAERTAQLAKTNEKLKQTNQELDTFIYRASHDLKQPVTSILGLVNVARLESLEPSVSKYFDHVETAAQRLDRVVTDLINVRQITQGKLISETLKVPDLIQAGIFAQQKQENFDNTDWDLVVPESLDFRSDLTMLSCILNNLFENSVKFADRKKGRNMIRVEASRNEKGNLLLTVTDKGTGIRDDAREKVFDMFFKGVKNPGTGIGLYLAKAAAEKMGGIIQLQSTDSEGSTFTAELPPLPDELPEGTLYV